MKRILCCWIFIFSIKANAQVVFDAYSLSTASADLLSTNGFFISKNPASIAGITNANIKSSQLLPYSVASLSRNTVAINGKWKNKGYAFDYSQIGIKDYKSHFISICLGLKLSKKIDFGLKIINRIQKLTNDYNSDNFLVEIGVIQLLNTRLKSGLNLKYRTQKNKTTFEKSSLSIAFSYLIEKKFISYLTTEITETGEIQFRTAIDYSINKNISTRIGWSSLESSFCGGIEYAIKQIKIEVSTSYHNNLGMSYGAALCYRINTL